MSDQWFYQAFGEEHGPVSFDQLREMASKHQLTPQHRVRSAENGEWEDARSVPELFPHMQKTAEEPAEEMTAEEMEELDFESLQVVNQEKQPEWSSLEDLDIQVSDAPTHNKTASRSSDSYGSRWDDADDGNAGNEETATDEEQWICDVLGVQLGPMPLADLRVLARKGEVGLDDPVRRADGTDWQPAKTVDGLFPGFNFHSDEGLPEVAPPPVAKQPQPQSPPPKPALPMIGDDFNQAINSLSSAEIPQAPNHLKPEPPAAAPTPKQPPKPVPAPAQTPPATPAAKATSPGEEKKAQLDKWLSDAVPSAPPPTETTPAPQPTEPQPTEPTPSAEDRAAQLRAEFEARSAASRAFTPPTPKKVKSSGPGMGEQFSGLMEKLKENPKILGVIVVLGLVFLLKYVPWPFGPSDQGSLDQIKTIGNTYKEMRTRKASPAEFDPFKKESLETLQTLKAAMLDAGAGINDRPKQELYWACGKLENMLKAGIGSEPTKDDKAYDGHIATAQALINGEPPPAPPDEEGEGNKKTKDPESD